MNGCVILIMRGILWKFRWMDYIYMYIYNVVSLKKKKKKKMNEVYWVWDPKNFSSMHIHKLWNASLYICSY